MLYIDIPKIDSLPFTFFDDRINAQMFAGIDSIEHENAIDGVWLVDTFDGSLVIRGSLLRPTSVRLKCDYHPFSGVDSLID